MGEKPAAVAEELVFSNSMPTSWKNGALPRMSSRKKLRTTLALSLKSLWTQKRARRDGRARQTDAGKAAVTNFGVLAEAQQILGIQDALAKCNVNYDAVEDCWAITTPHDDSIDKRKTCGIGPNLYIWDKGNTIVFWEDFTYMGSSELDIDDIILRGGDYKYTYICDYDNSDYGYDLSLIHI